MSMNADNFGTLYQTLQRTVARCPDGAAYAVPPMPGRAYHPQGWEVSWRETARQVEEKKATYQAAGYGLGHRVAILFEQRPEFVFHYFAFNALGVGVVPVNPDYRRDEIHYLVEHSEAVLRVGMQSRSIDLKSVKADLA